MTKQNVVVSDTKFGLAITVAVSNSSLFSSTLQKPLTNPGGYITISRSKLLKKLETGGVKEGRITAWVDSMRASSPTHIRSIALIPDKDENSWMVSYWVSFDIV
ncbi:trehalose-phosphatase [Ranunculus cassubicifolius]